MSIAPVSGFPPASSEPSSNQSTGSTHPQARPASGGGAGPTEPVSGTLPEQEISAVKNIASTYQLRQDVVEVHQDPEIKDQVIIQYLDQANNVVLQVPSNQELGVERGIAQEFQEAAKLRASAGASAPVSEGEKTHGN
jgi:hypothetical protein